MHQLLNIGWEIEQKRLELHAAADKYGLSSNDVLTLSEELDLLINMYYDQLIRNSKHRRLLS